MKLRWDRHLFLNLLVATIAHGSAPSNPPIRAGVAKSDITDAAAPAQNPLYARALVMKQGDTAAVIITIDAVAIGEIGPIGNEFLPNVRAQLEKEPGISPAQIVINPSHCHGRICKDVERRTVDAVRAAWRNAEDVDVAVGVGHEDRIMENRRLKLRDGREADVRRAYSLPPSTEVASIGPVDPEIGVLRLDRKDGRPLAVVYNFACHPIQGHPAGENTGDITGFASRVIEDNLGGGAMAFFIQGCGGDINPTGYKNAHVPHDAEPLGNMLGLSTLAAVRRARASDAATLRIAGEKIELPRAQLGGRIARMEAEQKRLLESLKGTALNLETFIPLFVKYNMPGGFPSTHALGYLHEKRTGREHWAQLDAENRSAIEQYIHNVHVMEELTRLKINLAKLREHEAANASGKKTVEAEMVVLRVGDFVLVTFPGELSVQVGLNIKGNSPHEMTFVAGYTNGYLYYAPTDDQLKNPGWAQEDCDCLLAPGWQKVFEDRVAAALKGI